MSPNMEDTNSATDPVEKPENATESEKPKPQPVNRSSNRLCIKNINKVATPEQIRNFFSKYGHITDLKLKYNHPEKVKNKLSRKERKKLEKEGKLEKDDQMETGEGVEHNQNDDSSKPKHDPELFRGMCFIGFKNASEAAACVKNLNKSFWKNQKLHIEYAEDFKKVIKRSIADDPNFKTSKKFKKSSDLDFLRSKMKKSGHDHEDDDAQSGKANKKGSSLDDIDVGETGRIMIRNLPYTATEDDMENLLKSYGQLNELNLIIDDTTKMNKGYCFATFTFPENAVQAFENLDGNEFQGRLIHVLPAREAKGNTSGMLAAEKNKKLSSFKKRQLEKERIKDEQIGGEADKNVREKTAFISSSNVAEMVAQEFDVKKTEVALDSEKLEGDNKSGMSAAVRLAVAEAAITKDSETVTAESSSERSRNTLLIKNIPVNTENDQIKNFFSSFGSLAYFEHDNRKLTCIIEYEMSRAAKRAAKNIRSRDKNPLGKGPPLLIDWALKSWRQDQEKAEAENAKKEKKAKTEAKHADFPVSVKQEARTDEPYYPPSPASKPDVHKVPEENTTIYIKNLNFETTQPTLHSHFMTLTENIYQTKICMKSNKKLKIEQSMGYGFVQFYKKYDADKCLRKLNRQKVDGHELELKRANTSLYVAPKNQDANHSSIYAGADDSDEDLDDRKAKSLYDKKSEKSQASTKICVRNIPFQAKQMEIEQLFKAYSDVISIRLPKKQGKPTEHRGFGFVEFASKNEAKKAIETLGKSTRIYGRRLVLEYTKD